MATEYNPDKGERAYLKKNLLNTLDEGTYYQLSQQTLTSLDILPKLKPDGTPETNPSQGTSSRSNTTIYAALNRCRTASGKRLLATWLRHPLTSKEKIDLRLDIIQHFVENNELRVMCYQEYLKNLPDLLRLSYKISKEKCSLGELMHIYQACQSIQTLCRSFQQVLSVSNTPAPDAIHKLFRWAHKSCFNLNDFVQLLDDSIITDSVDESNEYMVKPESSEDIAKLSVEISSLCSQARKEISYAAEDIGLEVDKSIKLEIDTDRGFGFKVTRNNEQMVRGFSNYEQLSTVKKDGYRFTNKDLRKLSTKYVCAKAEYKSLAKRIIDDIISKAVMYDEEVLEFGMAVTMIDVFVSLSMSAQQNNYIRPLILDSSAGRLDIERLRHPCIENQPDIENYVPNDILMSKNSKKFYIITGPNMGGKSTYIKSVAVAVIMAHCGSMIPAEDARISIIDGVFTRVGAGDKQVEGVSTFMEEMLDMSAIVKGATENSLVIIDELGRGTSTFDGFGLAWSISKYLATKTKCFTLFATHFHELTEMEEEVGTVGNLHVRAICDSDKLTMLYNIVEGVCNESYGINVAQYTNFPEHVIKAAEDKLKQFEEVPGFSDKKEVRNFVRDIVRDYMTQHG